MDDASPPQLTIAEQLRRFNAERERLMGGRLITNDERLPLPYSGVGGDVGPGEGA